MKAFQRFDPEAAVPEFQQPVAAKAAKAVKPQGFRRFRLPKAHLKLAKAGETLGGFSQALAVENPQETSALAALGALAGAPLEKLRITRAVLLQVPDGVPEDWAQGVADLLAAPPPPAWTDDGWKTLQGDALRFLKEWAAQADGLGWEPLDLFGAHSTAPVARMDAKGLVLLLRGRPVVALTEDSAAIRTGSGGALTYRRHPCPPAVRCQVWDLARPVPMKGTVG